MQRTQRSYLTIAAACGTVLVSTGLAFGQATTQPIGKDDVVLGLSVTNSFQSVKHFKANASVPTATVTGTSWNQSFIQSVEFDNYNGIRHNAQGNLLGQNFGTATVGSTLYTFQTRGITAGQTAQPATSLFYTFSGTGAANNAPEKGRAGGLSVSPSNNRLAVTSNEFSTGTAGTDAAGRLAVIDYSAAAGTGTGASAGNYHSIIIPSLRNGTSSRTQSTTWLDNNNVLVTSGLDTSSFSGNVYKVTVAADGSLSQTQVATDLFAAQTISFTNTLFEPTVSPYVFVTGSGQSSGTTLNRLAILDPANNFAVVKSLNFDTVVTLTQPVGDGALNTLRETAFDSKGNLIIQAYAGSDAVSGDYVTKVLMNAQDIASLTDNDPDLKGLIRKDQTSDATVTRNFGTATSPNNVVINGTSSSFSGNDVAITNIDLFNADVAVNIESGDYTQQYFGTSPKAALLAKLKNGKLTGTPGTGHAVGYSLAEGATGGTFRVKETLFGDASLDGAVSFADLVLLAQNYNQATGKVWGQGDFNYDEGVTFADLVLLAQNYNKTYSAAQLIEAGFSADFAADFALAQSLVPEPTSIAALGAVALLGARRRSR